MRATILGIDPGASGAIGMVEPMVEVWDMPATVADLVTLMRTFDPALTRVYVEAVHAMPGQGVTSTFAFGEGYGAILGVLAALGLPHRTIAPQTWKRQLGLKREQDARATKNAARALAQQLFPTASLSRVRDHGRAEALLIAEWGRRQTLGGVQGPGGGEWLHGVAGEPLDGAR